MDASAMSSRTMSLANLPRSLTNVTVITGPLNTCLRSWMEQLAGAVDRLRRLKLVLTHQFAYNNIEELIWALGGLASRKPERLTITDCGAMTREQKRRLIQTVSEPPPARQTECRFAPRE
jgi:hypothetical protein